MPTAPASSIDALWSRLTRRARRPDDFPLFCRELRTLIRAGMTVVEAVDTLASRGQDGNADALPRRLLAQLQVGRQLSTAIAAMEGAPPVLVAAVKAGERTSNLAEALDDYLQFHDLVHELRQKVVSASIYPALVTVLGFGISLFLILFVLPNFARMYDQLRAGAKGVTALMVDLSTTVSAYQLEFLVAVAVGTAAVGSWLVGGGAQRMLQAAMQRVPLLRARVRDFELAMLYQAVALLLKGGYPLTQALEVAGSSALSADLRQRTAEALATVQRGGSVSKALADAQVCDEVDRRLMAAAERNGAFHLAARTVSQLHARRFQVFVERTTRIVEPVLLMAVALMVGTLVVMMYLPVFDMATRMR